MLANVVVSLLVVLAGLLLVVNGFFTSSDDWPELDGLLKYLMYKFVGTLLGLAFIVLGLYTLGVRLVVV